MIDLAFILKDCGGDVSKAQKRIDRELDQLRKELAASQEQVEEWRAEAIDLQKQCADMRDALIKKMEQVRVLREALNFTRATIRRTGFEDDGPACSLVDILKVCKEALAQTEEK